MKIRRFVAKDMRTALTQIKEELGADAVIMSNKKIPEGVELMAAVDYNQVVPEARSDEAEVASGNPAAAMSQSANGRAMENDVVMLGQQKAAAIQNAMTQQGIPQAAMPQAAAAPASTDSASVPADSLSALLQRQAQSNANSAAQTPQAAVAQAPSPQQEAPLGSIEEQFKNFTQRLEQSNVGADDNNLARNNGQESAGQESDIFADLDNGFDSQTQASTLSSAAMNPHGGAVAQQDFDNMKKEMASIRQLLEHQVSGLMWQDMAQKDPSRALLVSRLKAIGVTEQLADQIAGYVPANVNEEDAWEQACELMARQINTTNNDIIHRGGVVALVGPTGVGKTTTVAKLAARFAQIHGADQVAMISTDTYRIGGYEQLATYGRIIGCQVKQAKDAQALDALIQQFGKKKLILIDTAGMGQRDMRLAQHLTTLIANARVRIRNYLVLGANAQQRVMQENVERFKKVPLSGCIYTKLDESLSIGEIISTSIQNGLPISYLTDGQRVPEDIKVANAEKLVTLADKMANKVAGNNPGGWQSVSMNPAAVV
ncbi:flagellar biosynthesis protein FlhF [Thalassomonas sp. RHCl1]|uniref:flagellar biosynthesis protein FlhF n=1 Tax=Thalassomonas sp. RHCl1 TaxID=2995320 RepID=UPI00248CE225|nr:flagellar biosynthesis protein FlhF [Thalassomonas sp. RHCl1]